MNTKRWFSLALVLLLIFGMAAAALADEVKVADDAIVLTYAEVNPIDGTDGDWAKYFKSQVETLTNGTVTVDIQASGVLGA